MARPRSDDKPRRILEAATSLFAEEGLNASTARIAKVAGVAEGTIFTYFESKDELVNRLYLELKEQLRASIVVPAAPAKLHDRLREAWRGYVDWGLSNPQGHRVIARLGVSDSVTAATRARAYQIFRDVDDLLRTAMATGVLHHQSPLFVGALLGAMADATIDFIAASPAAAETTCDDGFEAFWSAISRPS